MTNLLNFSYETQQVRTFEIDGEAWFTSLDVANILDYTDPSKMLKHVDEEDKQVINPQKLDTAKMGESFGTETFRLSIINESGLYACIFGSKKPEAKKFKKWVTSEVLPQIRKKGKYELEHKKPKSAIDVLEEVFNSFKEQQEELRKQKEQLEQHDIDILNNSEVLEIHGGEIENLKERIEDYRTNPLANDYFKVTISQYCKMNNLDPSRGQSISVGRKLTRLCSILEIEFNNNENANDYPYWLLKALFDTVEEFNIDFAELVGKYLITLQTENN